jgi:hypothetical protein
VYAFGEGWSVVVTVDGVMPWSRFGGCYCYGVYQACYVFYLYMLVDFMCGVLNSLHYVPVVLNVVVPACREVISERERKRGE